MIQRADCLQRQGISPVFVFDGERTPAKDKTNLEREFRRTQAQEALERDFFGDETIPDRIAELRKAVCIGWDVVTLVIDKLRAKGYAYFVAPYEADSQLAFLATHDLVDAVFTVDSDLVVLGCPLVFLKINYYTFDATMISRRALEAQPKGTWCAFPSGSPRACVGVSGMGIS